MGKIYIETGVIVMPLLPGDSLLFVAGALAAAGSFSLPLLVCLLSAAVIAGDTLNFAIGSLMRNNVQDARSIAFIKPAY
jgi:membrane-associated protein